MAKATRFLVGVLFLSMVSSATINAQPVIDGTFDGTGIWGEPVAIADGIVGLLEANADSLFITQDDTYYYFAAKIKIGKDWQSWGFTINTKSGGGSEEVWGYAITYGYTDLPDYVIKGNFGHNDAPPYAEVFEWDETNSEWVKLQFGAADSLADTEFSSDDLNDFVEVRLPKSNLGNPVVFKAQFYIGGDQWYHGSFDAVPDDENATNWNVASTLNNYASPLVEISGDAGWRLLSFPITGGTISDISDDTAVQGITGGADADTTSNVKTYNSGVFEDPATVSTVIDSGLGFALYFYDNTINGSSELPVTLHANGSEPSSDVTVPLYSGAANRFTLVGNPFASSYNTSSITATGGSIQNNIGFWNDATASYSVQDRTGSYIITPWQGFWVETMDASVSSITFPTSGKDSSDTSGAFFSKTVNKRGDINFILSSETTFDEAIRLAFREGATFGYDADDFGKLPPLLTSYATMAFVSNGMLKSVESLPYDLDQEVTVELQPKFVGVSGEFTFAWTGLETIPAEWELTLHDYEMDASVNMRDASEYVFTSSSQARANPNPLSLLTGPAAVPMKAKTEGNNRFGITIRPASVNNEPYEKPLSFGLAQNYPNPFNPSTTINYTIKSAGAVNLSVYNLMGQKVATLVNEAKTAGTHSIRWNAAGAASGMYYYRLEANGQSITRKMMLIK